MAFGKNRNKKNVVAEATVATTVTVPEQKTPEPPPQQTAPTDNVQTTQTGERKMSKATWGGLNAELQPVAPGLYTAEVISLKETASKTSGEPMFVLAVAIMDEGPFQGRRVFTNFVKSSEIARQIFARFCKAINLDVTEDEFNPEAAVGQRLRIQVRNRVDERTDEVRADVERFIAL